ncbi:MAG: OmpA family protein [Planctomycetes bacterium]|nr:OmpA family protein [Planctomycetota bacterium]
MSARVTSVVALLTAAVASIGCASVPASRYSRDIAAQKEYIATLEQRNRDLEVQVQSLLRQSDERMIAKTTDELYAQIARQLQEALRGLRGNDSEEGMEYDARRGAWITGTDLLFDSGSFAVSVKGKEILKKFAEAHKDQNVRFRVVGHTDRAPVVRAKTKQALDTDTNMELSARRAVAVMGQLKSYGISESAFEECVGMGNNSPRAPNDRNATNMKKNRRVEIFVVRSGVAPASAEMPGK